MSIVSTVKKIQHNDVVVRVEHTLWQAAAGAVVASLAATHGDVRVAVTAGVAAVLSAAKSLISGALAPAAAAVVPAASEVALSAAFKDGFTQAMTVAGGTVVESGVGPIAPVAVVAPVVVPVDVVETPSTPASAPPAAQ